MSYHPAWLGQPLAFELYGPSELLSRLHEILRDQGLSITKDGDRYLLELPFYGIPLDDPRAGLLNLGQHWETVLNVVVRLYLDNSSSIAVRSAYYRTPEGWAQISFWLLMKGEIIVPWSIPIDPLEIVRQLVVFFSLTDSETRDKSAAAILRAIGEADFRSPDDVYRVYDAVRTDVGGERRLIASGCLTKEEARRLRQTLNYPGQASGRPSRKVIPRGGPPAAQAMAWSEVTTTVRRILLQWVSKKVDENANLSIPLPRRH